MSAVMSAVLKRKLLSDQFVIFHFRIFWLVFLKIFALKREILTKN